MSDRFAPAADAAALIIEEEAEKASALAFGRLLRLPFNERQHAATDPEVIAQLTPEDRAALARLTVDSARGVPTFAQPSPVAVPAPGPAEDDDDAEAQAMMRRVVAEREAMAAKTTADRAERSAALAADLLALPLGDRARRMRAPEVTAGLLPEDMRRVATSLLDPPVRRPKPPKPAASAPVVVALNPSPRAAPASAGTAMGAKLRASFGGGPGGEESPPLPVPPGVSGIILAARRWWEAPSRLPLAFWIAATVAVWTPLLLMLTFGPTTWSDIGRSLSVWVSATTSGFVHRPSPFEEITAPDPALWATSPANSLSPNYVSPERRGQ